SGGGKAGGGAPAGPERDAVVATAARIRPPTSLAGATGVDEAGVHGAQVVPRDPEPLARVVEEAGGEDVAAGDELPEERVAFGVREIDADAALVAAQMLDEEVPARRSGNQPRGDEPADRIAEVGGVDFHDLPPPTPPD